MRHDNCMEILCTRWKYRIMTWSRISGTQLYTFSNTDEASSSLRYPPNAWFHPWKYTSQCSYVITVTFWIFWFHPKNAVFLPSYIWPDFWKRYHQMDLLRPTVFPPKTVSKVVIIKTKSATIVLFLFSSFPSPRSCLSSFPFPSLLWFGASRAYKNLLLTPFHLNDCKFR